MSRAWLALIALTCWPAVAIAAGLVIGRAIGVCETRDPQLIPRSRQDHLAH